MLARLKDSKFYIGITLVVQSVSFLVLFITMFSQKRSFAKAFLALAAVGGIFGSYLLLLDGADRKEAEGFCYDDEEWIPDEDDSDDFDEEEIQADDTASEDEFAH